METGDQFHHKRRSPVQLADLSALFSRGGIHETELRESLLSGTAGNHENATEIGYSTATARFGNVGNNGHGSPNELITPRERSRTAKRLSEFGAPLGHLLGDFIDK